MSADPAAVDARGGSARAGLGSRILAGVFLAPSVLHVVGRGGAGWWLVAIGLATPWLIGRAARASSEPARAGRVLAAALGIGFAVSVLPTLFGLFGFSYERVFFGAALAWLAWRGALVPHASTSRWPLRLRTALLAWGAWSVGSALYALWVGFPADAPWVVDALGAVVLDPLGFGSLVDPAQPLARLWVRLEMLVLAWAALEVALADEELPRRFARSVALALPAGVLVNVLAIVVGFRGDRHPLGVRISSTFDRAFRPLPDHNALGSALVVMLLPAFWFAARAWIEKRPRHVCLGWTASALSGLLLLGGTTSKSAFLGVAVAVAVGLVLWALYATGRARKVLLRVGLALLIVPIAVQALPRAAFDGLLETRYVRDVVRAARFDFVTDYLSANRYALWRSAGKMLREEPLAGVGLGRFPRRLPDFHDPRSESHFNPLQENAHNQYLQWAAEEGLVGAALGVFVCLLALAAGVRATRAPPPVAVGASAVDRLAWCALTASLVGLLFNLIVGHALLVPEVAGLFAVVVGVLVAGAARSVSAERADAVEVPGLTPVALAGLVLAPLGVLPALGAERTPLDRYELGCYPWLWQPGAEGVPPTSRLLAPDARWMQRWGAGSRMIMFVKTIVAEHLTEDAQSLDVHVGDQLVVRGFRLPQKQPHQEVNPVVVLKVDAPPGVKEGDLVEVRVVCDRPYAESVAGGHSQSIWGPRVWPATFIDPR